MRLKLGIALLVIGALCAVPFAVKAVTSAASSITEKSHRTPFQVDEDLDPGTYVIFERTGTSTGAGPITGTFNDRPTLSPQQVKVTAPDGTGLDVEYLSGASETTTQGNRIYTGVLEFEVEQGGVHHVAVGGEGRDVLVSRSIAGVFGDLVGVLGIAALGGLLFLTGGTLVIVDLVRRGRRKQPTTTAAAPGWYADPGSGDGPRYWDGAAWTEHTAP